MQRGSPDRGVTTGTISYETIKNNNQIEEI